MLHYKVVQVKKIYVFTPSYIMLSHLSDSKCIIKHVSKSLLVNCGDFTCNTPLSHPWAKACFSQRQNVSDKSVPRKILRFQCKSDKLEASNPQAVV